MAPVPCSVFVCKRKKWKILIILLVPSAILILFLLRNVKIHLTLITTHKCPFDIQETRLLRTKECWGKSLEQRWRRFYNDTTCEDNKHRYKLKTLLEYWIQLSGKHDIKYALMWGTLLGVERVNDVLPWDHDIDIVIAYKDILKLEKIVEKRGRFRLNDGHVHVVVISDVAKQHNVSMDHRKRMTCQGKPADKYEDPCSFQEPLSRVLFQRQFIDLYHYYDQSQRQILTIPEGKNFVMNKSDVFPLQNCSIMGMVSLCPNNPSRLLENWYGEGYLDKSQYKCRNGKWQDENGKLLFEKPFHRNVVCFLIAVLSCLVLSSCVIWYHKLYHCQR